MNSPFFSIIMPVYNGEKFIGATLECVKNQTFPYYEVICIDDHSSDRSAEIIQSFESKMPVHYLLNLEGKKGEGAARNYGLDKAVGKYVICLDCDDIINDTFLEKAYNAIEKTQADCIIPGVVRFYDAVPQEESKQVVPILYKATDALDAIFEEKQDIQITSVLRKSIIDRLNLRFYEDINYGLDRVFLYTFLLNSDEIYYEPEITLFYRQHQNSVLASKISSVSLGYLNYLIKLQEQYKEKFPENFWHYFGKIYIRLLNLYAMGKIKDVAYLGNLEFYKPYLKKASKPKTKRDKLYFYLVRYYLKTPGLYIKTIALMKKIKGGA